MMRTLFNRYLCFCSSSKSSGCDVILASDPNWNNTVPFVPPVTGGKVIKVYDGDTITIASKLPYKESKMYRFSVRLFGIDSPEIKTKNLLEKEFAVNSKMALSNMILGQNVQLKNVSTEKYGRILADVYLGDLHLNKWMLDNKLAVPYDGGTKKRPPEWDNDNNNNSNNNKI